MNITILGVVSVGELGSISGSGSGREPWSVFFLKEEKPKKEVMLW